MYVTKDQTLYEVLERTVRKNAGIMGGQIVEYMLLDVIDPDAGPFTVQESVFASEYAPVDTEDAEFGLDYIPVEPPAPLLAKLHATLDRWAEEAPEWLT